MVGHPFSKKVSCFFITLQNHLSKDARLTRNGNGRLMGWRKSRSFTTCTLARRDSPTSDRILWLLLPLALSPVHHPAPTMLPFWPSERASWLLDPGFRNSGHTTGRRQGGADWALLGRYSLAHLSRPRIDPRRPLVPLVPDPDGESTCWLLSTNHSDASVLFRLCLFVSAYML